MGGWMPEKQFWRSGGEKCFSLDIPFYSTFPPPRRLRMCSYNDHVRKPKPGESLIIPGLKMGGRSAAAIPQGHLRPHRLGFDLRARVGCNTDRIRTRSRAQSRWMDLCSDAQP